MVKSQSRGGPGAADLLQRAGLKPTRQRLALGALLFTRSHRHVTSESLFEEARAAGVQVSLATVYNTLHQFCEAGLLRAVNLDSDKRWYDTDVGAHHHFFVEETGDLIDVPEHRLDVGRLPTPPQGYAVEGVDIVIRLKPSELKLGEPGRSESRPDGPEPSQRTRVPSESRRLDIAKRWSSKQS
ncbi:MAG: Fur family transcriptional regulator [Maricaulaceae bacterium]|jgi:Fur family iron response transcriptional regulator